MPEKKEKARKEKKNQQTAPLKCGAGGAKAENAMCDDFPLNSKQQQQQEAQRKICRTTANQKTIIKCRSRTLTPSLAPAAAAAASVSRFIKEH